MGGMPGMMGGMGGMPGGMGGMGRGPRQDPPIEYPLNCTLEELFKGTSKKMRISRNVMEATGAQTGWRKRCK